MGCMGSKSSDAGDKEGWQRNAKIDRALRNDKKVMDKTIKILLLGMSARIAQSTGEED